VFDVRDGHVVHQLKIDGAYEVVLAPAGLTAYVAAGGAGGLWDLASGQHIRDLAVSLPQIKDAAFSPDGTLLATTPQDKTIRIWDVATGRPVRTLTGHTEQVFTPAFSPDGSRLLSGSLDGSVRLWDVATGDLVQTFTGHTGSVYSSAFTPDGRFGVSGGKDGTVRFWDVQAPVERDTLSGPSMWIFNLVYSPDGKQLFVGDADGTAQIWDVATQTVSHVLARDRYIDSSAFSPDGHSLLTGPGDDSPNVLWDPTSGAQLATLAGSRGDVAGFSADGRTMITSMTSPSGQDLPDIGLWDVATRQLIKRMDTNGGRASISPDGSHLFSYTGDTSGTNGEAWDIASGEKLWTIEQPGGIESATFSPDGRTILAAGRDDVGRLWDAGSGTLVREFHGHTNTIWDAVFSADGRFVLTASADKSARLWDARTGQQVRYFPGHASSSVSGVAISPDGSQVAVASFDGSVQLTPTDAGALIDSVCHRLLRDLTSDERAIYGISGDRPTCPAR
jgi:WD40 repeat protein